MNKCCVVFEFELALWAANPVFVEFCGVIPLEITFKVTLHAGVELVVKLSATRWQQNYTFKSVCHLLHWRILFALPQFPQ